MNDRLLKQARIIFIIGILLIIAAPFILTRVGYINFSDTGQIGDTIGGLTAPIASLLGSILVFYALRAQIDANRIIQTQITNQQIDDENRKLQLYFLDHFKLIREDINDFSILDSRTNYGSDTPQYITKKGAEAIHHIVSDLRHLSTEDHSDVFEKNPKLYEIRNILLSVDSLLAKILNSSISKIDKDYFKNIIAYLFKSKLWASFKSNEKYKLSLQAPCKKCGKIHDGIPDVLFEIIDSINKNLC